MTNCQINSLSISDIIKILKGGLEGLQFIHKCKIVHMDLSPNNLMVHPHTNEIVIIDFGLAQPACYQIEPCGTDGILRIIFPPSHFVVGYMAPEVENAFHPWNTNVIGPKADVFSLGIIGIEILSHTLKDPIYSTIRRTNTLYATSWLTGAIEKFQTYAISQQHL